jgi:hypothetical protein
MSAPKRKKAYNIDELRSKGLDNQETFLKLTEKWNSETRTGWYCNDYGIFTYYKNGVESIDSQLGFSHIQFDEDKINIFYSANRLIASDPVFPEQVAYVEYDFINNKQASFWWCPTLGGFLQTKDLWKITRNKEEYKSLVGMPHGEDGVHLVHLSFLSKETKLEHNPYGPASYCDGEFFPKYYFNGRLCRSKAEWQRKIAAKNKKTSTKRDEAAILMEQSNKPKLRVLELESGEKLPVNYTGIIKYSGGDKIWWLNGTRHREDGPAVEWANGDKHWYLNGKLHREDGPAVEWADGTKFWHLNGKSYSEANWKIAVEKLNKEREGERKENTSPVIETSQHSPGTVCQHRMLMDCVSSKPTVMQSIKTTAKKDFNTVVVRVAADKLSDVVQVALIAALKKALDNKTTNQIDKFFSSKQGKVFIKMMVGIIVPMMIQKFPERFQGILEAVSTESRIQAEVHIASTMVDTIGEFITPMLGHFAQSMEALEDSSTGVRVFVEQTNLAATSREESIGETVSTQSRSHLVS